MFNFSRDDNVCRRYQSIKPYLVQLKSIMKQEQFFYYTNKNGYIVLTRDSNSHIFSLLDLAGFFDFHCTNSKKEIAGHHQIMLYIYQGYRFLMKGFTCPWGTYEVHHLDSDPSNNSPSNLTYVTPQENAICASLSSMKYHGFVDSPHIGIWDSESPKLRLANLIKTTFERTMKRLGFTFKISSVAQWLFSLPADIGNKIYRQWKSPCSFGL